MRAGAVSRPCPRHVPDTCRAGRATEKQSSWLNDLEAQLALEIVRLLLARHSADLQPASIGIISPYNAQVRRIRPRPARHVQDASRTCPGHGPQVRHIRRVLAEALGAETAAALEVNSVDGFQGREKSVILLSTVPRREPRFAEIAEIAGIRRDSPRSLRFAGRIAEKPATSPLTAGTLGHADSRSPPGALRQVRSDFGRERGLGVGFVKDERRINVSMTRAKHSLLILGHAATLRQAPIWERLIDDAKERGCLLKATSPLSVWFETASKQRAKECGKPASSGGAKRAPPKVEVAAGGGGGRHVPFEKVDNVIENSAGQGAAPRQRKPGPMRARCHNHTHARLCGCRPAAVPPVSWGVGGGLA